MKEFDALVSIIVPIYGTEAELSFCIDSICKQSYSNIQIILVDDQSPDKCPEICDEYAKKDSRIMVIHQKNKGVSGARNTGLRCATGEYIMFVDSDDELYPDAVDVMLMDACKYNADIVWAPQKRQSDRNISVIDSAEECKLYGGDSSLILSLDGAHNINAVWGKLFRAEFIDGILFEEGKNINEDGFFMFQCYLKNPVMVKHNVSVYKYNTRVDSSSRSAFSEKYLSMLYFCNCKKGIITDKYPQYTERAYNMEVRTHLLFLEVLCRTDDKKYNYLCKESIRIVRRLYQYHKPINGHHKKLAWIVAHGLYPLYKKVVRFRYYR